MTAVEGLFRDTFGFCPTLLVRAPGRVNLIGEHIDYNDLPVFPMALQREVRIALRPRSDSTVAVHSSSDGFEPLEFTIGTDIEASAPGSWGNYVKAPARELARHSGIRLGFDAVLHSDIPVAAGLSSSSAIVNAVGLALVHVNRLSIDALRLADLMADAERFVGTRGGGMDQAISLGARDGCAARISFRPLQLEHVRVPDDWCFIVADSGEAAEKSGAMRDAYNLRRAQCDEALGTVLDHIAPHDDSEAHPRGYRDLRALLETAELLDIAERVLHGDVLRRFRHVVTEASRVDEAVHRMRTADLEGFGRLMDASHVSLREDYAVSSPTLDELVESAKAGGAAGARLTGAGFGGCIVALAHRSTVSSILRALMSGFPADREEVHGVDERVFVAVPSHGGSTRSI